MTTAKRKQRMTATSLVELTVGSAVVSELESLDHNNMVKSHQTKKKHSKRCERTTSESTVRSFPGKLRKPEFLPGSAVEQYMRSRSNGTADNSTDASVHVSKQILGQMQHEAFGKQQAVLKDPEYLHLDMSHLPLDMFDTIEFESADRSPEEWLASTSNATAPYFLSGQWYRKECRVLTYDRQSCKYEVEFVPSGPRKMVRRLNLKFDIEDEKDWQERRNTAEQARELAKSVARLDHFISQQPSSDIQNILPDALKRIHVRVIDGLPLSMSFPEPGTPLGLLLRSLTGDVIQRYNWVMKKAVLVQKLARNESTLTKYNQLRLPPMPGKPPVPEIGKVPCPHFPFKDRRNQMSQLHFSREKPILAVTIWLYHKWTKDSLAFRFMEVTDSLLSIPCSVEDFTGMQERFRSNALAKLQKVQYRASQAQASSRISCY
jgi:hypothetical protein